MICEKIKTRSIQYTIHSYNTTQKGRRDSNSFRPDGVKLADIIAMLSRWRSDHNITQNAFHSIIMLIQNVLLHEHKDQPTSQYDNNFPPTAYIADRLI